MWLIVSAIFMLIALPILGFTLDENSLADNLKDDLIENGFENVSVILADRRAILTYENRMYRDEIRAAKEVMALLAPQVEGKESITLIPQNRKIPLVVITIPADEKLASAIDVSLDVDSIWGKIQCTQKANSSSYKFDIVVHPQFKAQFGDHDDPVESQINLAPEIKMTLWKGMSLSAQLIIPLQNELGGDGDYWRPGLLTINQTFRLPRNTFVSATMGYFTQHRYGTDLEIKKYFANGRWLIGANVGYTGYDSYLKGVWYYAGLDVLTAFFNAEYRVAQYDLSLRATYGKFLYGDRGWRFDILRQFGEVEIGFFALKTERGHNGGFNFSIPIFPPKYLPTGPGRISPAKAFPWEYRYKGLPNDGIQYKTGNSIDEFIKRLNPDYIKTQMAEFEDW
jgi:hypothetical protein